MFHGIGRNRRTSNTHNKLQFAARAAHKNSHTHTHIDYIIAAETKQRRINTKWEKQKKKKKKKDCFETKLWTYESHYYRQSWINANANTNNNKKTITIFSFLLSVVLYSLRLLVPLLYELHTTAICVLHFSLFFTHFNVLAVSYSSSWSPSLFFASPKR